MAMPPYGAAVPTLTAEQFSYLALAFGGVVAGTQYQLGAGGADGLGLPGIASGDTQRARAPGEYMGLDFPQGRDITVPVNVITLASGQTVEAAEQAMALAWAPALGGQSSSNSGTEQPLWFRKKGSQVYCSMARLRAAPLPMGDYIEFGFTTMLVAFHATDPRMYSAAAQATRTGLGALSITNAGNYGCKPIITLTNAIASPTVTLSGSMTATQTTVPLSTATGTPASGSYYLTIGSETMLVTGGQGTTTLTVQRGVLNTTQATHASGASVGIGWSISDGTNVLTFLSGLNAGDVLTIDCLAETVSYTPNGGSAGDGRYLLSPMSAYLELPPGTDTLVVAGASAGSLSVVTTYASAWIF